MSGLSNTLVVQALLLLGLVDRLLANELGWRHGFHGRLGMVCFLLSTCHPFCANSWSLGFDGESDSTVF